MTFPRWIHHLYASMCGYFWIPCPNCGRMFGGHELGGTLWTSEFEGRCICPMCPTDVFMPGVQPWRTDQEYVRVRGQIIA